MMINSNKSNCLRIGHQALISNAMLFKLVTRCRVSIEWVTSCRYLGVLLISGPWFKCRFHAAKAKFYKAFNAIKGKVGRIASQEVTLTLVKSKGAPTLLYCLEVCPFNTKDIKSLENSTTCALFKIFQTNSNEIIEECKRSFDVKPLSDIVAVRKLTFLQRYTGSTNTICRAINIMCI